uniref:Uncharacterized protein n=1 Tax=Rhizophora mucronata TaxID=61149 RepID=A0A2P2QWA4_RHIMU
MDEGIAPFSKLLDKSRIVR